MLLTCAQSRAERISSLKSKLTLPQATTAVDGGDVQLSLHAVDSPHCSIMMPLPPKRAASRNNSFHVTPWVFTDSSWVVGRSHRKRIRTMLLYLISGLWYSPPPLQTVRSRDCCGMVTPDSRFQTPARPAGHRVVVVKCTQMKKHAALASGRG